MINKLGEVYRDVNSLEANNLFNMIFFLSLIINIVFYPLGLFSIMAKNVKLFKFFANFSMYTAITTVFMIYINM